MQTKCLTCKYEPNWSIAINGVRSGACLKYVDLSAIPAVWIVRQRFAEVCSDNSGFPSTCTAFENKVLTP